MMGVSRDTFCRYREAANEGGVRALPYNDRRIPNIRNRVDPTVEPAVHQVRHKQLAHGQIRVSNELCKRDVFVSASGVRSI